MADQGPAWRSDGRGIYIDKAMTDGEVWLRSNGEALDLPRLRALIAELTRRAALLAGEAGEAPADTYRATLTQGQYEAVCGILLGSKVAMPGLWTPEAQAALEAIRDAPTGEAPVAGVSAEERARLLDLLESGDLHSVYRAGSRLRAMLAALDAAEARAATAEARAATAEAHLARQNEKLHARWQLIDDMNREKHEALARAAQAERERDEAGGHLESVAPIISLALWSLLSPSNRVATVGVMIRKALAIVESIKADPHSNVAECVRSLRGAACEVSNAG